MRTLAILFCCLLLVGCSSIPVIGSPRRSSADYQAIVQPLLLPLGALIVAVRAGTPTSAVWLAEFNKAADQALPTLDGDNSETANRVRTSINNIRAMPDNLQVLEDSRSALLSIR